MAGDSKAAALRTSVDWSVNGLGCPQDNCCAGLTRTRLWVTVGGDGKRVDSSHNSERLASFRLVEKTGLL